MRGGGRGQGGRVGTFGLSFASQGSLNAPPNVHGGLSAPSGSYQKGWIKTGEPGWDAIQDAHQGVAPTIPNALPPPSAGTTAGPGTTIS